MGGLDPPIHHSTSADARRVCLHSRQQAPGHVVYRRDLEPSRTLGAAPARPRFCFCEKIRTISAGLLRNLSALYRCYPARNQSEAVETAMEDRSDREAKSAMA